LKFKESFLIAIVAQVFFSLSGDRFFAAHPFSGSPKELCWVSTQNSKFKTQNSNPTQLGKVNLADYQLQTQQQHR
jgi:hypothetical protein